MLATPPFHHRFHFGRQALLHYTDISVLFFGGGVGGVPLQHVPFATPACLAFTAIQLLK